MSPARWAHSSKPAAAALLVWTHTGTDGRTDRQTDGHYIVTQTLLRIDAGNATKRLLQTRRAAIDRYRLTAGPTAANPPHAAAAVNRWDRPVA